MTYQHNIYCQVNDTTYECISELVVTVPVLHYSSTFDFINEVVTFTELLSAVVKIP